MKEVYQPHLDGVRGTMAIWVFVSHAALACGFRTGLIPSGAVAVDIFMLLSGLLITKNFFAREEFEPLESSGTILKFFTRRFFRIAPLYYLLFLISFVFARQYMLFSKEAVEAFPPPWVDLLGNDPSQRGSTLASWLAHASFLFGLFPKYASNNVLPDWSLSLEMQFYFAIPFILIVSRRIGFTLTTLVLLGAELLVYHYVGLYLTPGKFGLYPQPSMLPFKINCFMVGVLMAVYLTKKSPTILVLMFIAMFIGQHAAFIGLALFCFLAMNNERETALERFAAFGKHALSGIIFRLLGDISYAVYLIHPLVLAPLLSFCLTIEGYHTMPAIARFAVLFSVATIVVIPSAFVVHHYIEIPGIRLGRHLAGSIGSPRRALQSTLSGRWIS